MSYKSKNLNHDYYNLKDAVLALSNRAVSVNTIADLLAKNYEKFNDRFQEIMGLPVDHEMKDHIKSFCEEFCENYIIKKNFECYFDEQAPFQLDEAILTGSTSEGLFLYSTDAPDMDFMCVLKNIEYSQKHQEDGSLMLRDDTPFVYAFATNEETQDLWSDYLEVADKRGRRRLSSRKLKKKLEENYKKTGELFRSFEKEQLEEVSEGAAVTICKSKPVVPSREKMMEIANQILRHPIKDPGEIFKLFMDKIIQVIVDNLLPSSDIVLSIFCEGWPTCAKEWITRKRLWPDTHQVEKIAQNGFHIVPKSSADGDFRLSFSCAETMLIKTLSPLQHRVMRAFKAVIKYHLDIWDPNFREIISSYHLKTIALWHFERASQNSLSDNTIVHHLLALLEELAEALRTQILPMYFMPKFNLFREVDDPEMMLELMANVSQLSSNFIAMSKGIQSTLGKTAIATGPITLTPSVRIGKEQKGREGNVGYCLEQSCTHEAVWCYYHWN